MTDKQLLYDIKSSSNNNPIPKELCGVISKYSKSPQKIYFVTSSSGNGILCDTVFTSREMAQKYITLIDGIYYTKPEIIELFIDSQDDIDKIEKELKCFNCAILENGEKYGYTTKLPYTKYDENYSYYNWSERDKQYVAFITVFAKTKEEAEEKTREIWRKGLINLHAT